MGPTLLGALLNEITKPIPFELAFADGTAQSDFAFRDAHNLPIPVPRSLLDIYLLTDLEGIGSKYADIEIRHGSPRWFPSIGAFFMVRLRR
jgi:hypothetical protein